MPESRRFVIPPQRRLRPRDILVSVLGHAAFVILLLQAYQGWKTGELQQAFGFVVDIPAAGIAAVNIPPPPPPAPVRRARPLVVPRPNVPDVAGLPLVTGEAPPVPEGQRGGVTAGVPGGRVSGVLGLGPYAGDARLWVRPMYIPEGGGGPIEMDMIVRSRLLAMATIADSLARLDSMGINSNPYAPASWVFSRGGQDYGMDGQWFYLGPIKIPTAILAFVPFPQGNIDQARQNEQLMRMRADLLRAAARSEAEDDFRRAVSQIRERRDRERREEIERREGERQRTNDRDRPIN